MLGQAIIKVWPVTNVIRLCFVSAVDADDDKDVNDRRLKNVRMAVSLSRTPNRLGKPRFMGGV